MKGIGVYVKKYKAQVILGPLFKFFEAVLELLNPIFMARIIDIGIKNSDKPYIIKYTLILVACNIIGFAFAVICQKCASVAATGICESIRNDMYATINNYSHNELDSFGTSTIVTRISKDAFKVTALVSKLIRVVSRAPFLLIGALILSIMINAKLSIIFCIVLPIIVVVLVYFTKITMPYYKLLRDKLDVVSRITRENLNGVRVIRAFNYQDEEEIRFTTANHGYVKDSIKVSRITSFLNPFIYLIVDFAIIAALYFGAIQVNVGGLTQGELIAFCNYFVTISSSLISISNIYVSIVDSTASWHRVREILDVSPSVEFQNNENLPIRRYKNKPVIEFKNVGFSFDIKEQDIDRMFLKNLSFKIMSGESIGIIGPTGSGKTTVANLMMRFYDCNAGSVELFGKNIKEYSEEQLRNVVSITQQRSDLFSGTLRENMQLRDKNVSDKKIIEALKTAQAWEFVKDLPNGLDYRIMAGGKNVSGGQKQRLTIARSLIGKPDLLILDDSASALDFMTDYSLRKSLKKDMDCATVLISQRVTTIKNCDYIIVLNHGDVVGMGKHKDLLKNCPTYSETYYSQTQRRD